MSHDTEYLLPAVYDELVRLGGCDPKVMNMLREAMGTPRYVIEAEEVEAAEPVEEVVSE